MSDSLPSDFDIVVVGTGIPESILAAALARAGKSVLHIDRNTYYCGRWSSFNLQGIETWKKQYETHVQESTNGLKTDIAKLLEEGEHTLQVPCADKIANIQMDFCVRHKVEEYKSADSERESPNDRKSDVCCDAMTKQTRSSVADGVSSTSNSETSKSVENDIVDTSRPGSEQTGRLQAAGDGNKLNFEHASESAESGLEQASVMSGMGSERTDTDTEPPSTPLQSPMGGVKQWTQEDIEELWRRFNFDLCPRVLYSVGSMVELLIQSDISRYCEFKLISRILTVMDGQLKQVPCSRAHVFNAKEVSMQEKRMMMKFVKFCLEVEQDENGYMDKPFVEFLKVKNLSSTIQNYIQHAIAMATDKTTTREGLSACKKFMTSVGRYGQTPFITPIYGTGELPQSFCRMCAVWGGVYCLGLSAEHIIIGRDGKYTGIITTEGQRINSKWLVLEFSYVPPILVAGGNSEVVSRGIFITDTSVMETEREELSLLNLPCPDNTDCPVSVLELPPSSMVCPPDMYIVHLTRKGREKPEVDLAYAYQFLFRSDQSDENSEVSSEASEDQPRKPKVLWSCYFQVQSQRDIELSLTASSNILVTSQPGSEIGLDDYPEEAKNLFEKICPAEEFLPKCPNPEDIIYDAPDETGEEAVELDEESIEQVEDTSQSKTTESTDERTEEMLREELDKMNMNAGVES